MDKYIQVMDVYKPVEFLYPFCHGGERFDIKLKEDETPHSLGMEDETFFLIEDELHCRLGPIDPSADRRKLRMKRDEKLEYDEDFPNDARNHRRGVPCG